MGTIENEVGTFELRLPYNGVITLPWSSIDDILPQESVTPSF